MMLKKILMGLVFVLLLAAAASAANEEGKVISGGKLLITRVDAKVDGKKDKGLNFGEKISKEAKPGSDVEFTIEVKNNYTNDESEITDIQITVTIEGIDDGDDMDEDAKEFDLDGGDDDKETVKFKIPMEVDEDTFNVLIEVEGDGPNSTEGNQKVEYEVDLEIQKEDNDVSFTRNSVSPAEFSCQRSGQLALGLINLGTDDEDVVVLETTSAELGIGFKDEFELTNDPFDADSKFSKTYSFKVPDDVAAGTYTIDSIVTYNDGTDTKPASASILVTDCEKLSRPAEETQEEEPVVVVQPPQVTTPTVSVVPAQPSAPAASTEEKSLLDNGLFVGLLIAAEVVVVIIIVALVVMMMRKKAE